MSNFTVNTRTDLLSEANIAIGDIGLVLDEDKSYVWVSGDQSNLVNWVLTTGESVRKYIGGKPASVGYDVVTNRPLDERDIVLTRDSLKTLPNVYRNIEVYADDKSLKYKWNGLDQTNLDNWKLIEASSGEINDILDLKEDKANKSQPLGYASLDENGQIPSGELPSFVDDVIEVADFASLPVTGESGKIYVTLDDNKTWRWSGTVYVEISASLVLGETSTTAYRGDRGKIAYDYSSIGHLPLVGGILDGDLELLGDSSGSLIDTRYIRINSDVNFTGAKTELNLTARGTNLNIVNPIGGWSRTLGSFSSDNVVKYQFGAYGTGSTLYYGYFGTAYNNASIKIGAGNDVAIGLASSSTPSTAYKLDVYGNSRVSGTLKVLTDPSGGDLVGNRGYNDLRYAALGAGDDGWKITGTTIVTNPTISGNVTFNGDITSTTSSSISSGFPVSKIVRETTSGNTGDFTTALGVGSGILSLTRSTNTLHANLADGFGGGFIFQASGLGDDNDYDGTKLIGRIYARKDSGSGGALQFYTGSSTSSIPLTIRGSGNVGIGTTSPNSALDVAGNIEVSLDPTTGDHVGNRDYNDGRYIQSSIGIAPTSATASGTEGDVIYTDNFIYVCIATNVWKRTAISTW